MLPEWLDGPIIPMHLESFVAATDANTGVQLAKSLQCFRRLFVRTDVANVLKSMHAAIQLVEVSAHLTLRPLSLVALLRRRPACCACACPNHSQCYSLISELKFSRFDRDSVSH